jgi:hypothetical protein
MRCPRLALLATSRDSYAHPALQGDFGAGHGLHAEALRIGKAIGDGAGIASALLGLGTVAQLQRDYEQASTLLEERLELDMELPG